MLYADEVMYRPGRNKRGKKVKVVVNAGLRTPVHLKLYTRGYKKSGKDSVPDYSFVPVCAITNKAVMIPRYGDVQSRQFYGNFLLSDCMLVQDVPVG